MRHRHSGVARERRGRSPPSRADFQKSGAFFGYVISQKVKQTKTISHKFKRFHCNGVDTEAGAHPPHSDETAFFILSLLDFLNCVGKYGGDPPILENVD